MRDYIKEFKIKNERSIVSQKFQSGGTLKPITTDDGKPILDKNGKKVYYPQPGTAQLTPLSEDPIFNLVGIGSGLFNGGAKSLASIPSKWNFAKGKGIWLPKTPRPTKTEIIKDAGFDILKLLNPIF